MYMCVFAPLFSIPYSLLPIPYLLIWNKLLRS